MTGGPHIPATELATSEEASNVPQQSGVTEISLAGFLVPLVTILALMLVLRMADTESASEGPFGFLMPLMFPGALALSTAILLDSRFASHFSENVASDIRTILWTVTLLTVGVLFVWVTDRADSSHSGDAAGFVIFLCLPTLLICSLLLWFAAKTVQRSTLRILMLGGFIVATLFTEWRCQLKLGGSEERLFMLHSLLVAFVLAVALCVWGNKEFSTPGSEDIA